MFLFDPAKFEVMHKHLQGRVNKGCRRSLHQRGVLDALMGLEKTWAEMLAAVPGADRLAVYEVTGAGDDVVAEAIVLSGGDLKKAVELILERKLA